MMKVTLKAARSNFFDRESVIKAADAARRRVLSRFGAFVRQTAKRSIRKRKGASRPGTPPSSHTGLLRDLIFFVYDRSRESVVIGPTLINRSTGAPETLEYGGDAKIQESRFVSGPKYGNRTQRLTTSRTIKVAARPYIRPAFEKELPGFLSLWKDSIR